MILEHAKNGIYSNKSFNIFKENYEKSGGLEKFENYFDHYSSFISVKDEIKEKILFFKHNLSLDHSINKFQVIICRNVLIYFNRDLTTKVYKLFDESLYDGSLLLLGESETLYKQFEYEVLCEDKKIYKKVNINV